MNDFNTFKQYSVEMKARAKAENEALMRIVQNVGAMVDTQQGMYLLMKGTESESANMARRFKLEETLNTAFQVVATARNMWASFLKDTDSFLQAGNATLTANAPFEGRDAELDALLVEMRQQVACFAESKQIIRNTLESHEMATSLLRALEARVLEMN